jgi:hypothetical protein
MRRGRICSRVVERPVVLRGHEIRLEGPVTVAVVWVAEDESPERRLASPLRQTTPSRRGIDARRCVLKRSLTPLALQRRDSVGLGAWLTAAELGSAAPSHVANENFGHLNAGGSKGFSERPLVVGGSKNTTSGHRGRLDCCPDAAAAAPS